MTDALLIEQLWKCRIKQLPMYIEKSLISVTNRNKEAYMHIITAGKPECEKDSQSKGLDNAFRKISKTSKIKYLKS